MQRGQPSGRWPGPRVKKLCLILFYTIDLEAVLSPSESHFDFSLFWSIEAIDWPDCY